MKVGIVSNAAYCIPLLQTLIQNRIQASVFADACFDEQGDFLLLTQFCNHVHIPLQKAEPDNLYFWLEETAPDIVFVLGYRHLIDIGQLPKAVLANIYNIHFGPLPAYRGPSPVFWQIKNGEENLAVTIHRLNEKFDQGETVWTKFLKRENYMSLGIVNAMFSQMLIDGAGQLIQKTFQKIPVAGIKQPHVQSKYYKRPVLKDVMIDWETMAAQDIVDLVLACNPWNKGAITSFNGRELKIVDAEIMRANLSGYLPGTVIKCDNVLHIYTSDQNILNITMLYLDAFIPARDIKLLSISRDMRFSNT